MIIVSGESYIQYLLGLYLAFHTDGQESMYIHNSGSYSYLTHNKHFVSIGWVQGKWLVKGHLLSFQGWSYIRTWLSLFLLFSHYIILNLICESVQNFYVIICYFKR